MKRETTIYTILVVLLMTGTGYANLTDGLVAYYPFNGNTNDESSNGNDGTVNGAILTIDRFGNANSAYYFDGASYIDLANDPSVNIAGSLTLSTWLRVDNLQAISSGQALVGKFGSSHGPVEDNQYLLQLQPGPSIGFAPYDDVGVQGVSYGPSNWSPADWVHIVATYEQATDVGSLYFNGALMATNTLGATPYLSNINLTLGATPYDGPETFLKRYYLGYLDDVRIYNRSLSSAEVAQLHAVEAIPAPGAILLGSIGVGLVGWLRRRRTL